MLLQDDDDDYRLCRTRAVQLEAGGFLVPVKLYTNACIMQAQVFGAPNGLFEQQ
jgi:hypothetical protein